MQVKEFLQRKQNMNYHTAHTCKCCSDRHLIYFTPSLGHFLIKQPYRYFPLTEEQHARKGMTLLVNAGKPLMKKL